MGLRTASARRPHVAVMAPALTDASQTQSFKLEPKPAPPEPPAKAPPNMTESPPLLDPTLKMGLKAKPSDDDLPLFPEDLPHPDEALLQVFKSMESDRPNTADLSSENEEFPLSSLEKELLESVDVMSIAIDDHLDPASIKDSQARDLLGDLRKRQLKLERRLDFLRRRTCKIQANLMGQHVSGEIAGVFENVHRSLKKLKELHDVPRDPGIPADFSPSLEKPKPISYGSTKALVRKLEMSAVLQANSASRQRHVPRYFGSGSVEAPGFRSSVTGMVNVPPWTLEAKAELQKVAGLLQAEVNFVQEELDSEATESSSGGESCDEMQNYNNPHQQYLSIQKRALWKYSTDRASIAARWTWLQGQISDLEYRIRQYTELYKKIRSTKGPVSLGGASPPPQAVPTSPTAVNGYRGQLPGNFPVTVKPADVSTANGTCQDYQCARTRPLVNFKKRKLLQVAGLHAVSKKAARPSTIRCGCVPATAPCALCTGRTDPTHPRDPPETLSRAERVALLDPSFHPVFSLMEDASQLIHSEAIMKTSEWQQRSARMKTLKVLSKAERMEKSSLEHRSQKLDHRKRFGRVIKASTMSALSAKLKNKIRGRKNSRHFPQNNTNSRFSQNRKRHPAKIAMAQLQSLAAEGADEEIESIGNNGTVPRSMDSPNSSPLLPMQSISGCNSRRSRIHSYDIDNIVIPYSVAASTRVEKLQYKEILTPKWRIVDPDFDSKYNVKNNGATVKNASHEDDVEDLSEEAVVARHDCCEAAEKKKFLSYMKLPIGYGRSRSHKRTDSRAESSGGNTPDPMSPHPVDQQDNTNSPLTSPPATPLAAAEDPALLSVNSLRRRTISQSRHGKDKEVREEARCNTPDVIETPPYERRNFPLCDETYEKMLKHMPENYQFKTNNRAQDNSDFLVTDNYLNEKVDSPGSESTESALGEEDPNDPEWIDMERSRDHRHKR